MNTNLRELEREAFEARERGDFRKAITLYEKIAQESPNWEHGQIFYDLAGCYEDTNDLPKAEENYQRALHIQPTFYIFVEGYASFLYRKGELGSAFDWYLNALKIELRSRPSKVDPPHDQRLVRFRDIIHSLGARLGLSPDEVEEKILGIVSGR
jgi:tetratricopeptide (TPR) repeat protein